MNAKLHHMVLAVVLSSMTPATATEIDAHGCCPLNCIGVDPLAITETGTNGRPLEVATGSFGRLKVSKDVPLGVSPDADLRICISYDAFGDPRVKCIQLPAPLM